MFQAPDSEVQRPHGKYREGYQLSVDDIVYVISAFIGCDSLLAPTSFQVVSRDLQVNPGEEKEADIVDRCALWSTRITNCAGGSGLESMSEGEFGTHWVMTSVQRLPKRTANIFDPLSTRTYSVGIEKEFIKICGPENVKLSILSLQKDGWGCGYICDFLYLQEFVLIKKGVEPDFEDVTEVPSRWMEMHWLLLQLRDLQDENESALDLGLQDFFKHVWEDPNKRVDIEAICSKLTVLILLQTVHFDSETNKQGLLDDKIEEGCTVP
jgi:hypothetical protein